MRPPCHKRPVDEYLYIYRACYVKVFYHLFGAFGLEEEFSIAYNNCRLQSTDEHGVVQMEQVVEFFWMWTLEYDFDLHCALRDCARDYMSLK